MQGWWYNWRTEFGEQLNRQNDLVVFGSPPLHDIFSGAFYCLRVCCLQNVTD